MLNPDRRDWYAHAFIDGCYKGAEISSSPFLVFTMKSSSSITAFDIFTRMWKKSLADCKRAKKNIVTFGLDHTCNVDANCMM